MRRRCCFLLAGAVAPLVVGPRALAQDAAPVAVSPVVVREVATGQRVVGTVMPLRTSVVGSAVDGRVVEFPVDAGEAVKEGQPVARLRTETLEIELAAAQAELTLRKKELAELVNGSLPEEIEQAEARQAAAKAAVEYAQASYKRMQALYDQQSAVTDEQLEQARAAAVEAAESFREASATTRLTRKGPRTEKIEQARARVELRQQQVNLIRDRIEKHTIVAPFAGYVTAEHTEVGAWLSQGDPVVDVIELREIDVETHVLGAAAASLQKGDSVRVEFSALPKDVFTGTIERVVPKADPRTRTFPVKVRVVNRIAKGVPLLKAGMLARLELPTGSKRPSPLVPKDALVLGGRNPMVFVVESNSRAPSGGTAKAVPVELGTADGGLIQVKGQLKAGQLVVVLGNERLQPGQKLSVTRVIPADEPAPTAAD